MQTEKIKTRLRKSEKHNGPFSALLKIIAVRRLKDIKHQRVKSRLLCKTSRLPSKVDSRKKLKKMTNGCTTFSIKCTQKNKHTHTHKGMHRHSHTLTFQGDMSADIWSDSVSPMWFCGDGVKYKAVPPSVLIYYDTVRRARISPGHSLRESKA